MLKFIFLITVVLFSSAQNSNAQSKPAKDTVKRPEDEIRKYYLVMLKAGSNRTHDSATAAKIQDEHLANINRLYYDGKIKVAGPFGRNPNWLGLFIFDVATEAEVKELLQTDAAVSSGRLAYEILPWYTAPIGSFIPGKPKKE